VIGVRRVGVVARGGGEVCVAVRGGEVSALGCGVGEVGDGAARCYGSVVVGNECSVRISGDGSAGRASRASEVEERLFEIAANDAERGTRGGQGIVVTENVPPDVVRIEELAAELVPVGFGVGGGGYGLVLGWTGDGPAGFSDPDGFASGDVLDAGNGGGEKGGGVVDGVVEGVFEVGEGWEVLVCGTDISL
jgi:hypothetical protein